MALITCKECSHKISDEGKTCPQCGAPVELSIPWYLRSFSITRLIVISLGVWFVWSIATDDEPAASNPPPVSDAECIKSLHCWGDRHMRDASIRCDDQIAKLAKFQAEWTDGILDVKFSRYAWVDETHTTILYQGDKVKFQNGFGAWQNHIYTCQFDPASKTVLAVRAWPGQL